jgi:hypothetical protein
MQHLHRIVGEDFGSDPPAVARPKEGVSAREAPEYTGTL